MTITTIYRVFFPWNEFEQQREFEAEHKNYKKVGEDTIGTTYEYRTDWIVDMAERKEGKNNATGRMAD